jgi:hypothetical protein
LGSAFNTAYSAQLGNVTYYVTSRDYGHPAYLEVRDPRGGLKRLDLGNYHKIAQAKQACERHYEAGCDWVGRRRLAAKRPTFDATWVQRTNLWRGRTNLTTRSERLKGVIRRLDPEALAFFGSGHPW